MNAGNDHHDGHHVVASKEMEPAKDRELDSQHSLSSSPHPSIVTSTDADDEKRTMWQNVKRYRKVVYCTLGLTSAILLYGYDHVIIGTVSAMPEFQHDFGELLNDQWILPSSWLAIWNVASPVGAMVGAIVGGWSQDRIGRRPALAISSFLSAVAVAIMFVSYIPDGITARRVLFLAGKLFQGAAIGAVMAATQTYMSEILPPCLRGSGMAFFPTFTLLGQLMGALVIFGSLNKTKGYAIAFGSQWPFSFLPIIVAFLIPESPAFYVRKRRMEKALSAQARLDPPGTDTQAVVAKILAEIEHEEVFSKSSYMDCFRGRNARRTFIVMFANALPSMFGLHLMAKASYFLQIVGMRANLSIVFLILAIVLGLLANAGSIWVVTRVGRRRLILSSLVVSSAFWASMGIANCFTVNDAVIWWTAATMMVIIVVCGLGVWPASFAVAAETSALQLRAKTQGVGWLINALMAAASGIALPYVFNPDEGNLRGKTGFMFVAACGLAAVMAWAVVPEMKGRGIGEIDKMFELGLGARQFKGWKSGGEVQEQDMVPGDEKRKVEDA